MTTEKFPRKPPVFVAVKLEMVAPKSVHLKLVMLETFWQAGAGFREGSLSIYMLNAVQTETALHLAAHCAVS